MATKKNRVYPAQVPDDILEEGWLKKYWKTAVAWSYIAICLYDFLIAPNLVMLLAYHSKGVIPYAQWDPVTLKGSGLFHMAFGAILGVAAWTHPAEISSKLQFNQNLDGNNAVESDPQNTVVK